VKIAKNHLREPVWNVPSFMVEVANSELARVKSSQAIDNSFVEWSPENGFVCKMNCRHPDQLSVDERSVNLFDSSDLEAIWFWIEAQNSGSKNRSIGQRKTWFKLFWNYEQKNIGNDNKIKFLNLKIAFIAGQMVKRQKFKN
jgi:hypothetical protein